jgi:hypothetical protein
MNGLTYIKSKQRNWAIRQGYDLVGGTIPNKGEKNYLDNLTDNLFGENISKESKNDYNSGDGNETKDGLKRLAKMKAVHSSSAIVVNVFQYWQKKDIYPIVYACKLCSKNAYERYDIPINASKNRVKFEQKFEISKDKNAFPRSPNIDIVINHLNPNNTEIYAIESKFTEPYYKNHSGLKEKYIDNTLFWKGIPNLYELAKKISPDDKVFRYLDAPQLLKHILGLKNKHNKNGFRLLYLWYDVIGKDGTEHRKEIEQFAEIAKKDNIKFRHITYQEILIRLSNDFYFDNENYLNYITDRYL